MRGLFTNTAVGLVGWFLFANAPVLAQLTATVDTEVIEEDGLFTYHYSISNAITSSVPVNLFLLDVGDGGDVVIGEQLDFGIRSLVAPEQWIGEYQPYEVTLDQDFNVTGIETDANGQPIPNRSEQVVFLAGDGLSCGPGPGDLLEGDALTISLTSEYGPQEGSFLLASWDDFCEFLGDVSGTVMVPAVPPASDLGCDFDGDGDCDLVDIDQLGAEIVAGVHASEFDLTGDGLVDIADMEAFLADENVQKLNGDADFSGTVDFDDFVTLSNHFGESVGWSDGDFVVNGTVDFDDFVELSNNFGEVFAAAAVPEPETPRILLVVVAAAILRRRR